MTEATGAGNKSESVIRLEVLHEGEHWIPCVYMTRVVEEVAKTFDSRLRVEKVVTKTFAGARRYMSLVRLIGRQLPVPSIIINEAIAFDITPPVETLKAYLDTVIGQPR